MSYVQYVLVYVVNQDIQVSIMNENIEIGMNESHTEIVVRYFGFCYAHSGWITHFWP